MVAHMPIRFVLGRAGTGKTRHCFDAIEAWTAAHGLGGRAFFLVPQQATFSTQRALACSGGSDGERHSVLNARVVSFETLSNELLTGQEGQEGRDVFVSSRGRRMIISQVLRDHARELRYFRDSAQRPHLAARLDATLSEMQQELLAVEELEGVLLGNATIAGEGIADKLHDLKLIATEYERYLGQERLDPVRRLRRLTGQIADHPLVHGSLVLVDGFSGFTAMQIEVLIAMARGGRRMDLCLIMDADDPIITRPQAVIDDLGVFARVRRTYSRLHQAFSKAGIDIEPPLLLKENRRSASAALQAIEREWEMERPAGVEAKGSELLLVEAADVEQEVIYAARQIRTWQMQGLRLRDIGILCRDLEPYYGPFRRVFAEHGIAGFIDRRRELAHHPLVRYIRIILTITQRGWRKSLVLELIKTGLFGLDVEEAEFLENFALRHGIDGSAWIAEEAWAFVQTPAGEDEVPEDEREANAKADALRRRVLMPVATLVSQFKQATTIRGYVRCLYDLLCCEEHHVRGTLAKWIKHEQAANNPEAAQEHQQSWKQVMALFDDAVRLLGESRMAGADFVQTMEAGLEEMDLALTPPTLDQVTVGQIDRSRSPEFLATIVMGMNEGEFPKGFVEDAILSDNERRTLRESHIELGAESSRQMLAENMLGYVALTRSSQRLLLTRTISNAKGKPNTPSPFWGRVKQIVPGVEIKRAEREVVDGLSSPAQAGLAIVRYATHKLTGMGQDKALAELGHWMGGQSHNSPIAVPMFFGLSALGYANSAKLQPATLGEVFRAPLHSSVSRLETFAACPFKHFASYGLKLKRREEAEFSSLDLGNAFHSILEKIALEIIRKHGRWADVSESEIDAMADEVAGELRGQLLLSSQRNRYLLEHIKKTLRRIVRDQRIAESAGDFRPAGAEVGFGGKGAELPPLEIQTPLTGSRLMLYGRIDRVDIIEEELRCAVYDYKTRGKTLELQRVQTGLALQLLTYLLVLQEHGHLLKRGDLTPVGAFYVGLLRAMESKRIPQEATPEDEVEAKPRGAFVEDAFDLFDRQAQPGSHSKTVQASVKVDGTLGQASSDAYSAGEFATLMTFVRTKLGELAEHILAGEIAVEPYKMGTETPCGYCDYRSVCRIDPLINRYNIITHNARQAAAELLSPAGGEEPV